MLAGPGVLPRGGDPVSPKAGWVLRDGVRYDAPGPEELHRYARVVEIGRGDHTATVAILRKLQGIYGAIAILAEQLDALTREVRKKNRRKNAPDRLRNERTEP